MRVRDREWPRLPPGPHPAPRPGTPRAGTGCGGCAGGGAPGARGGHSQLRCRERLAQELGRRLGVVDEGQRPASSGPGHVGQPAFLFQGAAGLRRFAQGTGRWEAASIHAQDHDVVELQPLGGVGGGQGQRGVVAAKLGQARPLGTDGGLHLCQVAVGGGPADESRDEILGLQRELVLRFRAVHVGAGGGPPRRAFVDGAGQTAPCQGHELGQEGACRPASFPGTRCARGAGPSGRWTQFGRPGGELDQWAGDLRQQRVHPRVLGQEP